VLNTLLGSEYKANSSVYSTGVRASAFPSVKWVVGTEVLNVHPPLRYFSSRVLMTLEKAENITCALGTFN
jgi:hypothetical protein